MPRHRTYVPLLLIAGMLAQTTPAFAAPPPAPQSGKSPPAPTPPQTTKAAPAATTRVEPPAASPSTPPASTAPAKPARITDAHRVTTLHEQGAAAMKKGDAQTAAGLFAGAYAAHDDPCSPQAQVLLLEAHDAHAAAYERTADQAWLCRDDALLADALAGASCPGNRRDIVQTLAQVRQRERRDRITCVVIPPPSLRLLADGIPLAFVGLDPPPPPVFVPTLAPARPRRGLKIAGGTLLATGMAAVAAVATTAWLGTDAERKIEAKLREGAAGCEPGALSGECQALDARGETMNRLAIASSVIAGALVVSGVALLIASRAGQPARRRGGLRAAGGLPGWGWRF